MKRGFYSGLFWGALVSVAILAMASLLGTPPQTPDAPSSVDVAVPAGSEFNRNRPDARPVLPQVEEAARIDASPAVTAATSETAPSATDTQSAATPLPALDAPATPAAPADPASRLPQISTAPATGAAAPSSPTLGAGVVTREAVPTAPALPSPTIGNGTVAPQTRVTALQPEEAANPAPTIGAQSEASPAADAPAPSQAAPAEPAPAEPVAADPAPAPAPTPAETTVAAPAVPEATPAPTVPEQPDATPATTTATAAPRVRALPGSEAPEIPEVATETAAAPEDSNEAEAEETLALDALTRNAVPFENAEGKPLMSIVLKYAGADGLDRTTLSTFSFPVTFAVDPTIPDAAEAAQAFRDAGHEVIILAPALPQGATPSDLAQLLTGYVDALPQAVGLMDAVEGGFQNDRSKVTQVVEALDEGGHGMLTYDRGLNSAQQIADRAGLPAALVFRELDADREDGETIRRYLDRAAFRAGQEDGVIMVGHSYPETVTALFSWVLEPRSQSVKMAPVSAVLRAQ